MGKLVGDVAKAREVLYRRHEDGRGGLIAVIAVIIELDHIVHVDDILSQLRTILEVGIEIFSIEGIVAELETWSRNRRLLEDPWLVRDWWDQGPTSSGLPT